jgi:hypothetical protein
MSGEGEPRVDSVVFSAAANLDEATVQRLKDEFGLELKVRASRAVIDNVLNRIGDVAVVYFDKSYPGFDKVFDKTSPGSEVIDVINPVELHGRIRDIESRLGRLAGPQ